MKKALIIILIFSLGVLLLSGCTGTTVPHEEAYALLQEAVQNSLNEEMYYIQETINRTDKTDKKDVNLRALLNNRSYDMLVLPDGTYDDYKVNITHTLQGAAYMDIVCGPSSPKGKETVDYLFRTRYEDAGKTPVNSKTQMTTEDFIQTDEFKENYALSSFINELAFLKESDIVKYNAVTKNRYLVLLNFEVSNAHVEAYESETGKTSLFRGSTRVEIELAYERLISVVCYAKYTDTASSLSLEKEPYNLFISYYGAKFTVPDYDSKDYA